MARNGPFQWPALLVGLLVISAIPGTAKAWNDTGHEIIAALIYDQLSPEARQFADELLKQHPRYKEDLLAGLPAGVSESRYAFLIAATWPDMVRSQTHPMRYVANHPAWHYIDLPYVAPGFTPAPPAPPTQPPTQPPIPGPKDIVEALTQECSDLRDASSPAADRAQALCWVLHLCGDIHQPLHCANWFSAQFPQGDRGGNLLIVVRNAIPPFSHTNLHAIWDQMLGNYVSIPMIEYVAAGLKNDPQYRRERFTNELSEGNFAAWAKASHDLAVSACYLNGNLHGVTESELHEKRDVRAPILPPDYLAKSEPIAARQAMLAAYRGSDLLNSLLTTPKSPHPTTAPGPDPQVQQSR